ncbi:hypothetical protein [Endozoicomonas lisbonensis]|uniref:Uncharacterized protein n=1 Tax=Endozoicomonas lisbonensis TaxID=3120522 RepID=A0ABV2SQD4_9GAMM
MIGREASEKARFKCEEHGYMPFGTLLTDQHDNRLVIDKPVSAISKHNYNELSLKGDNFKPTGLVLYRARDSRFVVITAEAAVHELWSGEFHAAYDVWTASRDEYYKTVIAEFVHCTESNSYAVMLPDDRKVGNIVRTELGEWLFQPEGNPLCDRYLLRAIDKKMSELSGENSDLVRMKEREALYNDVHWAARTLIRYQGIHKERTAAAHKQLKQAVDTLDEHNKANSVV